MLAIFRKLDRLKRRPRWFVLSAALLIVVWIGLLDYVVGEGLDLSVLYVPVIAVVCWRAGFRAAVLFSVLCSFLWLVDNWISPNIPLPAAADYWETAVRFASFLILVVLLTHLQQSLDRESALARCDALTGLANIKSFVEQAERAAAESRREQTPLTVVFFDCDHFKEVNDEYGHPRGDELLKQVAAAIRSHVRKNDVAARMGGDEFAVLLPRTGAAEAEQLAGRLKSALDAEMRSGNWPVTFSMGVATFSLAPDSVADLIRESDNLMYAVKHSTRDRIQFATMDETFNTIESR